MDILVDRVVDLVADKRLWYRNFCALPPAYTFWGYSRPVANSKNNFSIDTLHCAQMTIYASIYAHDSDC